MNKDQALILLKNNKQLINEKNQIVKLSKSSDLIHIYTNSSIWSTVASLPEGNYKEIKGNLK